MILVYTLSVHKVMQLPLNLEW